MINPFCGLSVIFYGFISHLIGLETINIPEIFSGVHGLTVTFTVPLSTQVYKWTPANLMPEVNPFTAKDVLIDFTLSKAGRFYLSNGDPLAVKGLKNYLPYPFHYQGHTYEFTLSNARQLYSSKGDPLAVTGLIRKGLASQGRASRNTQAKVKHRPGAYYFSAKELIVGGKRGRGSCLLKVNAHRFLFCSLFLTMVSYQKDYIRHHTYGLIVQGT